MSVPGGLRLAYTTLLLLDDSFTAFFVGGCTLLPNTTGIPWSLTVGTLDRRLQDLFSHSPWYNVIPMG
jgi:hypothetical protein